MRRRVITLILLCAFGAPVVLLSSPVRGASPTRAAMVKKCHKGYHRVKGKCRKQTRPAATPTPTEPPGPYYLALGDSLTSGFQPGGHISPLAFPNRFLAVLQQHGVHSLLNLGCPGETSESFRQGACPYPQFVPGRYAPYPETSSQMAAALAFIHDHPGAVRYVTLNIGANDLDTPTLSDDACLWDNSTVASRLDRVDANLRTILSQLRAALGDGATIIVLNYYDPFQNRCAKVPDVDASTRMLNERISADAALFNAPVADVYEAFGGSVAPNPSLCTYTNMCLSPFDVHPNPAGHDLIAAVIRKIAGL